MTTAFRQEWLSRTDLTHWRPPLFHKETNKMWQVALVQGVNNANRVDKTLWYVVERHCVDEAIGPLATEELARAKADELVANHGVDEWTRLSVYARELLGAPPVTRHWRLSLDEVSATQILKEKHTLCIQAAMDFTHVMYAWLEPETEYIQLCTDDGRRFDDEPTRVRTYLERVLRDRPYIVLVGVVDVKNNNCFYIYDGVKIFNSASAHSRRCEFANYPLVERLMHIEAILRAERADYIGDCVSLAPFQAVHNRRDMRIHTEIFVDTCEFSGVIRRLSAASSSSLS